MDGEPSKIFVLSLSPKDAGTPHVEFMATVSQLIDERRRESLLACRTAEDMYRLLAGGG
jgi:PTS system nitrogen regulatory IIA component